MDPFRRRPWAAETMTSRDDNNAYNVALSQTHVFGSSVVHEVRVNVNSFSARQD